MAGFARGVLVIFAVACVYAWFVDEAILSETIAALLCGIAGWAVLRRAIRVADLRVALSPKFIGRFVRRIPYAAVRESLDLLGPVLWKALVLRRPQRGRWIALRYARDDAFPVHERGRRAIVIFASNLTPNALPLDIDADAQRLVLHQLVFRRESAASDPEYPF